MSKANFMSGLTAEQKKILKASGIDLNNAKMKSPLPSKPRPGMGEAASIRSEIISNVRKLSRKSLDPKSENLLHKLRLSPGTRALPPRETSIIIRKLLTKAGTDVTEYDGDAHGDGDQSPVRTEANAQILRELFAMGGDIEQYLVERNSISAFGWMCLAGDRASVERALDCMSFGSGRTNTLEQRITSMRLSPLLLTIALSKHPSTVQHYTGRAERKMDHVGVASALLRFGARPDVKDVTGKTACHYGAGKMATETTLKIADMCIRAAETCWAVGREVVLDGLSKETYNGWEGTLGGFVCKTDRRVVLLKKTGKELAVKPENIFQMVVVSGEEKKVCILKDTPSEVVPLVDIQDRLGTVALHEVVMGERSDVAIFLLEKHSASMDIEDLSGCTPRKLVINGIELGSPVNQVVKKYATIRQRSAQKMDQLKNVACDNCGKQEREVGDKMRRLLQCTVCKSTFYCGRDCQKTHWKKQHKKDCKNMKKSAMLVLGNPTNPMKHMSLINDKMSAQMRFASPKGVTANTDFWVKVQSNGIDQPLLIYDESRTCFFYLEPGNAGHKELVEKVTEEKAMLGRKSYFEASFNDEGDCMVFLNSSMLKKW